MERLLQRVVAALSTSPGRLLVLGPDAGAIEATLRARGHDAVAGRLEQGMPVRADGSKPTPGSLDAVIAIDWIERVPWDRWALQRIHTWLARDGVLLLTAPNLLSPLSLLDPRYVAAKLAKQLPRLRQLLGRAPKVRSVRGEARGYTVARLRLMLEELGFTAEPGAGRMPLLATRHVVLVRRRPSLFGLDPARPFPDAAQHRARFERDQRTLGADRDAWSAAHAAKLPAMTPREFDPADPSGARVLVLAPHPDDEIIGCGGTLNRLVRAGARVTVLQATDGSASAAFVDESEPVRRTVRLEEAAAVARAIGIERTIFWREDNQAFVHRPELVDRLVAILEETRPTLILVPFITDIHPDHVLLARILSAALGRWSEPGTIVLGYEIWSRVPANAWCDVGSVMADLEQQLLLYETAMKVDDFVHGCAARNYANALALTGRPGFVEAFFQCEVTTYRSLVEPVPGGP